MNIIATQYTLEKRALEIYIAGCKAPHCKGCFNPETWDFNQGIVWHKKIHDICEKIIQFGHFIDKIMIFGGEPLDSDHKELYNFLRVLREVFDGELWLFTRYEMNEVPNQIILLLDYIKCGPYQEDQQTDLNNQFGFQLATANQNIFKIEKGK